MNAILLTRSRLFGRLAWMLTGLAYNSWATDLVAHWPFAVEPPPYADLGPHGIPLALDPDTATPLSGAGVVGVAAQLDWSAPPGVATRMYANDAGLQTDSFGFSFWIRPVNLNPGDNLLAKEMTPDNTVPAYSRMAWQVCLQGDNGSGYAAAEFIVRGDSRARGDFFGNARSAAVIPLYTDSSAWTHLAGGYDSATGRLVLFVNGVETLSGNSSPGAQNSDGGPLAVGSVRNGADFVAYAGIAFVEDLQLYASPPTAGEAVSLRANPGETVAPNFRIADIAHDAASGDTTLTFDAVSRGDYVVAVSRDLSAFTAAADRAADAPLAWDEATAQPLAGAGLEGDSIRLNWVDGSSATRLATACGAAQADTFGFSFWIRPFNLNPYDNLIAKEMAFDNTVPAYSRIAWQVGLQGDNGSGYAAAEFIVRGDSRACGDFFGTAVSSAVIPLHADSSAWMHLAGGYDSATGQLVLFVNGVQTVSANSSPGAHCSDGSALAVGSVRNGSDFVAFAGITRIDDLHLYGGPISAAQAEWLHSYPGSALDSLPRLTARWALNETEPPYALTPGIENMPVAAVVSKAEVDAVLGSAPRDRLFYRLRETHPTTGFGTPE